MGVADWDLGLKSRGPGLFLKARHWECGRGRPWGLYPQTSPPLTLLGDLSLRVGNPKEGLKMGVSTVRWGGPGTPKFQGLLAFIRKEMGGAGTVPNSPETETKSGKWRLIPVPTVGLQF